MTEVETNGVQGTWRARRFRLSVDGSGEERELTPGEVVSMPERGFGEKINVNLSKVIESPVVVWFS